MIAHLFNDIERSCTPIVMKFDIIIYGATVNVLFYYIQNKYFIGFRKMKNSPLDVYIRFRPVLKQTDKIQIEPNG